VAERGRPQALSVRQPHVWAIVHAGKRIENRTKRPPRNALGQRLLLHASKGCTRGEYQLGAKAIQSASGNQAIVPPLDELDRGGIVGVARLARGWVNPDGSTIGGLFLPLELLRWWVPGQYGWIFSAVAPLPFEPCAGALGLWTVPDPIWIRYRTAVGSMLGL
jgi:hypothetical protein